MRKSLIFQGKEDVMRKVNCFVVLIALLCAGCSSRSHMESFLREDVDVGYVNRIAIVPFENNSKDQFAAGRVRDLVATQVLASGMFDVVDKGLVDSSLREEAVDLSQARMDGTVIKRLGQRLNVQAFLMGTIDQSEQIQRGNASYPTLSLTLRLVDIYTGMIFWQASGQNTGDSLGKRLFGLENDDDFSVALKLVRELLGTLDSTHSVSKPELPLENKEVVPAEENSDEGEEIIIVPQINDQG